MKRIVMILILMIPLGLVADSRTPVLDYMQAKKHIIGIFWDGDCLARAPLPTAANDSAANALSNGSSADGAIVASSSSPYGSPYVFCNFEELESRILSPIAVFFNKKTGMISKNIGFFDETCPYKPISISVKGNEITMFAVSGRSTGSILTDANAVNSGTLTQGVAGLNAITFFSSPLYPDCDFEKLNNKTFVEVRKLKNGRLIRKFILQNLDDFQ